MRPFSEEEWLIFFGREGETSELVQRLGDPKHRFVAVIGSSGVGKSSLVNAGMIPALRSAAIPGADSWQILRMSPGEMEGNPFLALATRLAGISAEAALGSPQDIAKSSNVTQGALASTREHLKGSPSWGKIFLVVDQFEELFSSAIEKWQRDQFVALIVEAVKSERVVIVVTLRADFYAHCLEYPELAALLRDGSFPLARQAWAPCTG